MKPIRTGIAGAGLMGRWHAQAARRAGAQITAIADPDPRAAEGLAARLGAQAFPNLAQMLEHTQLDALHICTPPDTHLSLAARALDAGLHLLVEKPLTARADETQALLDAAADRNRIVCPVHQFLFQDGTRKAARALPRIGRLHHIRATFCSAGGDGGAGDAADMIAADILPHPLALMRLFLGDRFSGSDWRADWSGRGELRAEGRCEDVTLSIFVSMHARPTVSALQLLGSSGSIHLDLFHGYAVVEPGDVSKFRKIAHPFDLAIRTLAGAGWNLARRTIEWQPAYPGLQRMIEMFYRAVRGEGTPPVSPADAVAVARVRDRLIQEMQAKRGYFWIARSET